MDINPKNYPITILFSGNLYDIRGLQFFSVMDKRRFIKYGNTVPSLNKKELEFICIKDKNDYYFKYEFIKFIYEVGHYHKWMEGVDKNITNPIIKNIYYQYLLFPDAANNDRYIDIDKESDDFYRKILVDYILFNDEKKDINEIKDLYINKFDVYDPNNKIKIDIESFFNKILQNIKHDKIIGFQNSKKNLIKKSINPGFDFNGFLPLLYLTNLKKITGHFPIKFKNDFIYDKKIPNMFDKKNVLSYIDLLSDISKLVIENYLFLNKYPRQNPDQAYNPDLHEHLYYGWDMNRYGTKSMHYNNISEIPVPKLKGNIKKLKTNKYIFVIDDNTQNLDKDSGILKKKENALKDLVKKMKDVKMHYFNDQKKKIRTTINNLNLLRQRLESVKYFQDIINSDLKYIEINYKDERIIGKVIDNTNNSITFNSVIKDNWLNKNDEFRLYSTKININKCLNFGLNINNNNLKCFHQLFIVINEDGYGPISQKFFRNDDNFKVIYDIHFYKEFTPLPNLLLLFFEKLGFKKGYITIYNYKFKIIESYSNWISKQTIDEELKSLINLKKYLEHALLYVNLHISILNPKFINIKDFLNQEIKKRKKNPYGIKPLRYEVDKIKKRWDKFIKEFINKFLYDKNYNIKKLIHLIGGNKTNNKLNKNVLINNIYYKFKKIAKAGSHRPDVKLSNMTHKINELKKKKKDIEKKIIMNNLFY